MRRGTFAEQWALYEAILPADAGDVQRAETRRAFYAGAVAYLNLIANGMTSGDEATDDELAYLDSLYKELTDFPDLRA